MRNTLWSYNSGENNWWNIANSLPAGDTVMVRTVSNFFLFFFNKTKTNKNTHTPKTADKCNYAQKMCPELSTNITAYTFMQFEISMII